MRLVFAALGVALLIYPIDSMQAQNGTSSVRAELQPAALLELPGEVDSNSPAVWHRLRGVNLLFVMTSMNGQPRRAWGTRLTGLGPA
jgi:hypothetical protein